MPEPLHTAGFDLSDIESYGPAMAACTAKERRFAYALGTGVAESYSDAARLAGYSNKYDGAKNRAHEAMARERVRAAIREVAGQQLETLAGLAIKVMRETLLNKQHPERQKTAATILSRLGWTERASVDVSVSGRVTVSHTDAALEDLRRCKELNFPQAALEQIFGFSGLGRYEALLAERDARRPKVIEHIPAETTA
jgi:hypothetical protein